MAYFAWRCQLVALRAVCEAIFTTSSCLRNSFTFSTAAMASAYRSNFTKATPFFPSWGFIKVTSSTMPLPYTLMPRWQITNSDIGGGGVIIFPIFRWRPIAASPPFEWRWMTFTSKSKCWSFETTFNHLQKNPVPFPPNFAGKSNNSILVSLSAASWKTQSANHAKLISLLLSNSNWKIHFALTFAKLASPEEILPTVMKSCV